MDQSPVDAGIEREGSGENCSGESRIESLEKEIAFLQRELELFKSGDIIPFDDKYNSSKYWRDRCTKAENELDVLRVIYANLWNSTKSK